MNSLSLNQFLMLYMWFPLTTLLFFLLLIARFYGKFSGEKTRARLFVLPVILFGVGAVRYASVDQVTGDALGDVLFGAAGLTLIGLCYILYRLMLLEKKAIP